MRLRSWSLDRHDPRRQRIHRIRLGNYGDPALATFLESIESDDLTHKARIPAYRIGEYVAGQRTACVISESLSSTLQSLSSGTSALGRRRMCSSAQLSSNRNPDPPINRTREGR